MRTFIQLRNSVGYAVVRTQQIPDHTTTPEHTTILEIDSALDGESFLRKKYNEDTKTWTDAPVFKYAIINTEGYVVEIRETVFEHELNKTNILWDQTIPLTWKWNGTEWIDPSPPSPLLDLEQLAREQAERQALLDAQASQKIEEPPHTHE